METTRSAFEINYLEFLDEIESEDKELETQSLKAESEIAESEKEVNDETSKFQSEIDTAPYVNKTSQLLKYQRETEIKRQALNQELFNLNRRIPDEEFKKLIELLTQKHTNIVEKYKAYINRRIATLLLKKLPYQARWCWKCYPESMKVFPGFPYTITYHNKDIDFWVTADIPAVYNPADIPQMLQDNYPKMIEFLNKALIKYDQHIRDKWAFEARIANMLIRNNVKTYFDLLKIRPFMYEIIFNYYTKNGTCRYKI